MNDGAAGGDEAGDTTPSAPPPPPPSGPCYGGAPPEATPPPSGPDGSGLADTPARHERGAVDHAAAIPEGSSADLWAFAFDSPLRAQEALLAALRMVSRKHLELEDSAIVAKIRGRVRITQTRAVTPAQGAVGGAWLGILIGLFLGPGGPIIGAVLGAVTGGLLAKLRNAGIDDNEMKRMGDGLRDDEAALFLLVENCHRMRALQEVSRFPGRVLASSADPELVDTVRARLAVDPWDG